jgi:hypothetical protein
MGFVETDRRDPLHIEQRVKLDKLHGVRLDRLVEPGSASVKASR